MGVNFEIGAKCATKSQLWLMCTLYAYAPLERKVDQKIVTYVTIHCLFVTYFRNIENQ